MLTSLFQDSGFRVTLRLSLVILQGPFSWKRPIILELPGCRQNQVRALNFVINLNMLTPPFNQIASGAVSGFLRAAKNQNLRIESSGTFIKAQIISDYDITYHRLSEDVRSPYPEAW